MSYKVYHYQLWRDNETGAYYARFNNNTVEVTREQYYELMSHENADRYAEKSDKQRLKSIDEVMENVSSEAKTYTEEIVIARIMFEELLAPFDEADRIIIRYYLTKEMTAREIEKIYHIPRSTVSQRGKKLLKILEKILEKWDKSGV